MNDMQAFAIVKENVMKKGKFIPPRKLTIVDGSTLPTWTKDDITLQYSPATKDEVIVCGGTVAVLPEDNNLWYFRGDGEKLIELAKGML